MGLEITPTTTVTVLTLFATPVGERVPLPYLPQRLLWYPAQREHERQAGGGDSVWLHAQTVGARSTHCVLWGGRLDGFATDPLKALIQGKAGLTEEPRKLVFLQPELGGLVIPIISSRDVHVDLEHGPKVFCDPGDLWNLKVVELHGGALDGEGDSQVREVLQASHRSIPGSSDTRDLFMGRGRGPIKGTLDAPGEQAGEFPGETDIRENPAIGQNIHGKVEAARLRQDAPESWVNTHFPSGEAEPQQTHLSGLFQKIKPMVCRQFARGAVMRVVAMNAAEIARVGEFPGRGGEEPFLRTETIELVLLC